MKLDEFKTLIKDKNLSKEEDLSKLVEQINTEVNNVISNKKTKFSQELEDYKNKLAEANLNLNKTNKEYENAKNNNQSNIDKINELNDLLFISNKSQVKLDENLAKDVRIMANRRVKENNKTFEEAVDEVLGQFHLNEKQPTPKKVSSSPSHNLNINQLANDIKTFKVDENNENVEKTKKAFGINQKKDKKPMGY